MIYAVRFTTGGRRFIKFGRARNVANRLKALQTSSPWRLAVMAVADWPDHEESRIHAYLWSCKARKHSEWFHEGPDTDYIIALLVDPLGIEVWHKEIFGLGYSTLPRRLERIFRSVYEQPVDKPVD